MNAINEVMSRLRRLNDSLRNVPEWITSRMQSLNDQISFVSSKDYIGAITGTIGQNVL